MRLFMLLVVLSYAISSHAITSRRHLNQMLQAKRGPVAADKYAEDGPRRGTRMQDAMSDVSGEVSGQATGRRAAPAAPRANSMQQRHSYNEISRDSQSRNMASFNPKAKDFYTVQLLGSRDKFGLELYLRNSGIIDKSTIISENRNGALWYVALYGHYDRKSDATNAISDLPKSLRDHSPWVRMRSDLQYAAMKPRGDLIADEAKQEPRVRFKPVAKRHAQRFSRSKRRIVADNTDKTTHVMLPPPQVNLAMTPEYRAHDNLAKASEKEDNTLGAIMEIDATS